ncbi:hypothetical protein J8F10_23160 [Gemmata sp. G18]|uniref:Uncharacterized protein n=1 Tax=Gemmata palustris TaxID=2822762 RepID=A0ABS5BWS1_9BACT|nr:hypothetical protein [Gemmata palustris]MBP3958159.1 hypothetical protein [Gemmata palustris]
MRSAILATLFLAAPVLAAEEKSVVKEIPTKDLKVKVPDGGKASEPTEIKTADDLAKSPVLKDAADDVKKSVDFSKEKLLVFAWAGSGGDKVALTGDTKDGKTALAVTYTRGLTRDLRQHVKLFVVPKDAEVKVAPAK